MSAPLKGSLYGVPPGADFVHVLFRHLNTLAEAHPPEFLARIHVLVPTRRMQRRLKSLFESDRACLLPKIGLVSDVSHLAPISLFAPRVSQLARILDLKNVIGPLVAVDDRLSDDDVVNLSLSLSALLDEMQGEGVTFDRLESLVQADLSGHWERSLGFLRTIRRYLEAIDAGGEALHRAQVEALCLDWKQRPPKAPIIIAGSTGSRATTRMLMTAVANLRNGHVILPGFDFDLPQSIWARISDDQAFEDHPQYRFATFLRQIDVHPDTVVCLGTAPDPRRNQLTSLMLRPAPITDQWLSEGPNLGDLKKLSEQMTLVEARDARQEALSLAIAIVSELQVGRTIALITPDATQARRVTAELSRWQIRPDDSGGIPLTLTPLGRFVRQTARIVVGTRSSVDVIALLKHPLTRQGPERGPHMRFTQELELFLRERAAMEVDAEALQAFSSVHKAAKEWVEWLAAVLEPRAAQGEVSLGELHKLHLGLIAGLHEPLDPQAVFAGEEGQKISEILLDFQQQADDGRQIKAREYLQLLDRMLNADSARAPIGVRPDVMIWGALEARVQGADTVILCGLNEGVWPDTPPADPWLNRAMRRDVGLLLPERQIGLAAHDFQQAVGAPRVILSRALRINGSEAVPSRWLSRMTNLLEGLRETHGDQALAEMRKRGNGFIQQAEACDAVTCAPRPCNRPAPAPPVHARPRDFAVTEIQKLVRDPYAVYARRILKLKPLEPLVPVWDARKKGTVLHSILELFFAKNGQFGNFADTRARLSTIAQRVLNASISDPSVRIAWLGQLDANAQWLFEWEAAQRAKGVLVAQEVRGHYEIPNSSFSLRGKADRIDQLHDGQLVIFDYKTGTPPRRADIERYDPQLIIEAAMAEQGAFAGVPPSHVSHISHVGVGRTPKEQSNALEGEFDISTVPMKLLRLLGAYAKSDKGYASRRAMDTVRYGGDYDHLARFGEWDEAATAVLEPVGQ